MPLEVRQLFLDRFQPLRGKGNLFPSFLFVLPAMKSA